MKPDFEKKILLEYIDIIENCDRKKQSLSRAKIVFLGASTTLFAMAFGSLIFSWFSDFGELFLASLFGATLVMGFIAGSSKSQAPLTSMYLDGKAIRNRLKELNS